MTWFNDEKREKQILSGEQDILTAEQSELGLLRQILAGQALAQTMLATIQTRLDSLTTAVYKETQQMAADLSGLTAAVNANTTVEGSAITLIQQIADQLRNSSGDQAAVDALATQLQSSAAALAAAVTANTSAAGTPAQPTA